MATVAAAKAWEKNIFDWWAFAGKEASEFVILFAKRDAKRI